MLTASQTACDVEEYAQEAEEEKRRRNPLVRKMEKGERNISYPSLNPAWTSGSGSKGGGGEEAEEED